MSAVKKAGKSKSVVAKSAEQSFELEKKKPARKAPVKSKVPKKNERRKSEPAPTVNRFLEEHSSDEELLPAKPGANRKADGKETPAKATKGKKLSRCVNVVKLRISVLQIFSPYFRKI